MVNIMLEGYDISQPWIYEELKNYIKPDMLIAVVAFSFRDASVGNAAEWDMFYSKERGKYYSAIVHPFEVYGILEENITFINYFSDTSLSAAQKIKNADIVYFPGGLPDRTMDRICEFGLTDVLKKYDGIIMGYSAGAVIQLEEYHLSSDEDYPEFCYCEGLGYLSNFYLEVHYENTSIQNDAIARVLSERQKTVYATAPNSGAIIADNGVLKLVGNVHCFTACEHTAQI